MTQETLDMDTPQAESDSTQLVVLEDLNAKEVFSEKGVPDLIEKVKALAVPKLDPKTDEGLEERRSLAYKIARTKTGVDNMGKEYVGELKKVTTAIDGRRKHWRDTMYALQEAVRKPLTDHENAEKARKAGHTDAIQQMRDLMAYDYEPTSADVEKRITQVAEIAKRDFEEFAEQAQTVADNASGRLSEKLAAVIKAEQDAAELEELRKKQAEQDEKNRQVQLEKEAEERAAAKVQADLDAANKRAEEAEKRAAAPQQPVQQAAPPATTAAPPATTAAPASNPDAEHKRKINQQIVQALMDSCMLSESAAKAVVIEIARGKIPNTTINY